MTESKVILPILNSLPKVVWQNGFTDFIYNAPEIKIFNTSTKLFRNTPIGRQYSPHTVFKYWTVPISGYINNALSSFTTIDEFLASSIGQKSNSVIMDALVNGGGYLWGIPRGFTESQVINKMRNKPNLDTFRVLFGARVKNDYALDLENLSILTPAASIKNSTLVGQGSVYENGSIQDNTAINQVVIDIPKDGVAITDTLEFVTTATTSTSTTTTNGISDTSSQNIGLKLSDALKVIPGVNLELDMSTSKSASVDISSTKAQIDSKSVTQSNSITVTVQPGQSILAEQKYTQQEITIPFSLPAKITGNSTVDIDLWNNRSDFKPSFSYSQNYSGSDVLEFADYYGYIPILFSDLPAGTVLAKGEITNVGVGLFTATDSAYKQKVSIYSSPTDNESQAFKKYSVDSPGKFSESKFLTREETYRRRISYDQLPSVLVNAELKKVGLYYSDEDYKSTNSSTYHLGGSDLDDIIYMALKGQSAYSFGGDDRIYGSVHDDNIYLDGGLDFAQGGEGNDTITSYSGVHSIDSGFGADTINIYLDDQEGNLGAHLINLGNGNDVLSFFKNDREINSIAAVVNDFSSEDLIYLHDFDDLSGEVIAGSFYLKENNQFVFKFANYCGSLDPASTRGDLIEYALLNAGSINFNPSFSGSAQDVFNNMVADELLRNLDPLTQYSDLLKNEDMLVQALDSIAIGLDLDNKNFLSVGLDAASQFSSISTLTSHVIQRVLEKDNREIYDYIEWL